jgi:hypothetical protein
VTNVFCLIRDIPGTFCRTEMLSYCECVDRPIDTGIDVLLSESWQYPLCLVMYFAVFEKELNQVSAGVFGSRKNLLVRLSASDRCCKAALALIIFFTFFPMHDKNRTPARTVPTNGRVFVESGVVSRFI